MKRLFLIICRALTTAVLPPAGVAQDKGAKEAREEARQAIVDRVHPNFLRRRETKLYHCTTMRADRLLELGPPPTWPPDKKTARSIVLQALSELEPFTEATPDVDVVIREVKRRGGGLTDIYYSQVIEGLPVEEFNRLQMRRDGVVIEFASRLLRADAVDPAAIAARDLYARALQLTDCKPKVRREPLLGSEVHTEDTLTGVKHEFTSSDRTDGRWLTDGDEPAIYCGWSWLEDEMELHVIQGIHATSYKPPPGNRAALERFLRNLPDIALRLANRLEEAENQQSWASPGPEKRDVA